VSERTYPHGVSCWVDLAAPDPEAAGQFYGGLFGWTLTNAMPPGAGPPYLVATLDELGVSAIAPGSGPTAIWNTYIAVDDADAAVAAIQAGGGTLTSGPEDAGPGGRTASVTDPAGAPFRLWQARRRPGAQLVNVPGAWNFSDLHTSAPERVLPFYTAVFGWVTADLGAGAVLQVPGYGDHLAATVDPGIRERQASAPAGFADVIGALVIQDADLPADWHVTFSVADRDESAAVAEKLGGTVLTSSDATWSKKARIRDPQGAEFSISQFSPPVDEVS
jgi:predicted enzyme related to lactoylglutathione lyase